MLNSWWDGGRPTVTAIKWPRALALVVAAIALAAFLGGFSDGGDSILGAVVNPFDGW